MRLVRCISERKQMPGQLVVGKKYWVDESTIWKDDSDDEYVQIYLDEDKQHRVGNMHTSHFETIYRYLNHGGSLSSYINSHIGFLLKDIIGWCVNEPSGNSLASNVITYIRDHHLDVAENMEKEFIVNSVPFREFAERGMEKEYEKYMGYTLYCIDKNL